MRYREGASPDTAASGATDGLTAMTATYTLVVGVGLIVAGVRTRLKWLLCLGVALTATSGSYLAALFLGVF
ncbi:MAG: hypothetical protein GWN84_19355 [Gammaproteobacteria bacterium]|nr:hypothetical protein [Gammaproteobacteria bacterium]NIR84985.1 hypothetical protein [Gammaproteobacteria bacterium]NIR88252.1 hypothetical protein [Gammaproteobacteria bacterium]NIU06032.1 hypothetical protein [Gammaproteobacteria bacterium]NIV73451.1 hypothetical protein [Gammaproteobacteria bacterium]